MKEEKKPQQKKKILKISKRRKIKNLNLFNKENDQAIAEIEQLHSTLSERLKDYINETEFDIVDISEQTVTILVLGKFEFTLWIGNNPQNFECYTRYFNYVNLEFSEDEQKDLHYYFNKIYKIRKIAQLKMDQENIEVLIKNLEKEL